VQSPCSRILTIRDEQTCLIVSVCSLTIIYILFFKTNACFGQKLSIFSVFLGFRSLQQSANQNQIGLTPLNYHKSYRVLKAPKDFYIILIAVSKCTEAGFCFGRTGPNQHASRIKPNSTESNLFIAVLCV